MTLAESLRQTVVALLRGHVTWHTWDKLHGTVRARWSSRRSPSVTSTGRRPSSGANIAVVRSNVGNCCSITKSMSNPRVIRTGHEQRRDCVHSRRTGECAQPRARGRPRLTTLPTCCKSGAASLQDGAYRRAVRYKAKAGVMQPWRAVRCHPGGGCSLARPGTRIAHWYCPESPHHVQPAAGLSGGAAAGPARRTRGHRGRLRTTP